MSPTRTNKLLKPSFYIYRDEANKRYLITLGTFKPDPKEWKKCTFERIVKKTKRRSGIKGFILGYIGQLTIIPLVFNPNFYFD